MPARYYSQNDIAQAMGVQPGTVRQWVLRGKLPEPSAVVGRSKLWTGEKIETWLNAGRPEDRRKSKNR